MNHSVREKNRIVSLDIIRGIAIFAIFFVNIPSMLGIENRYLFRAYDGIDSIVRLIYDLLIQTKFYSIFAFLFGIGFYLFMSRAEAKGKSMNALFTRRLLLLFAMGILHMILLWNGDILALYAVQGFWLFFFYRAKPKTVLIVSLTLLLLYIVVSYNFMQRTLSSYDTFIPSMLFNNTYTHYTADLLQRAVGLVNYEMLSWISYTPEILGLFALGVYCAKIKLFNRTKELATPIRIVQWTALVLSVLCWVPIISYYMTNAAYASNKAYLYIYLGGKSLAAFYVTTIILLLNKQKLEMILRPFRYVGRMALTNYLLQTIFTVLLVPLFIPNTAALPLWSSMLICVLFFSIQVGISKWWLSRFEFGPMEWLWRIATYWEVQPIRRKQLLPEETLHL
ncbi:DUF418 domain-containing protein [Paenibacillus albiflavus]|uniref:DUF418 domain-containing protein n=1 Tax=Paenibacillus albiflavus TaxID=2545760 RepID=A0A4R4E627_9BACL|nr:DUF418 domain-containing protein [Paenibacillus albiflavus]TCZ74333.1 DUF418 domain-containing protein [Paenibacillus albiflavus]